MDRHQVGKDEARAIVNKRKDGRANPCSFRVSSAIWSGKIDGVDQFFYFEIKKEAEAKRWRNKLRSASLITIHEEQEALEEGYQKQLITMIMVRISLKDWLGIKSNQILVR